MLKAQRLEHVDVMRGIAIILVVIQHILQTNGYGKENPVSVFILSFHMPLFFAISGYITQKVTSIESWGNLRRFIYKKAISIALPCLVWTLFVNNYILVRSWHTIDLVTVVQGIMHPGLWFLKSLFFILIAYGIGNFVLNKLRTNHRFVAFPLSLLATFVVIALLFVSGIEGKAIFMYTLSFMGGGILTLYPKTEKLCLSDGVGMLAFFCFFILSTHWQLDGGTIDDLYKIIISSVCFIVLLNFTQKFVFFPSISRLLQMFGRESLSIYVIHFHLCVFADNKIETIAINPFVLFIITYILAICICCVCAYVSIAVKKNKYLGLLLFGKKPSRRINNV